MTKEEIKNELLLQHNNFIEVIKSIPVEKIHVSKNEKWSPAQQLNHIHKCVSPLRLAFTLPKFLLKMMYGKANRQSRTYETIVQRYHEKLQAGGKSTATFLPSVKNASVDLALCKLKLLIVSLCEKVDTYSEGQLDTFILPHPLLGKLTLREMLYFTIYHVQHHQKQIENSIR